MLFNFLIGGITGVFLSDVPVNVTVHGSFFVMAHFHYTIMGGLIFGFFGGLYYWLPKMTGVTLERRLSILHFWTDVHLLQLHVLPAVLGRDPGPAAARLRVRAEPPDAERLLVGQRLLPGCVVPLLPVQLRVVGLHRPHAVRRPTRGTRGGSSGRPPTPVPRYNFERIPVVLADPYHYGEPDAPPVADLGEPSAPAES